MKSIRHLSFFFAFFLMFAGTTFISSEITDYGKTQAAIVSAEDSLKKEESCGVDSTGSVITRNFSICREDISYNVLYMSFAKIFNEFPILSAFLYDESSKLDDKGYSSSIGGSTIALISGFSYLVLFAGLIIVTYATIKVLYSASQSGNFLNGSQSKKWMILRSIGILIAITPMGTITLSQLLIFIVAILSIMGGNFFHSTFIANIQEESVSIDPNMTMVEDLSLSYSNNLISANVCQIRTTKSLTQKNIKLYKNSMIFFEPAFGKQLNVIGSCINPENKYIFNEEFSLLDKNSFKTGNVDKVILGNRVDCNSSLGLISDFDPNYHGNTYSCGSLEFNIPKISVHNKEDAVHKSQTVDAKKYIAVVDAAVIKTYDEYNLAVKLNQYNQLAITNQVDFKFENLLRPSIDSLSSIIIREGSNVYNSAAAEYGHKNAVGVLYMYLALVQSNLLGSRSSMAESMEVIVPNKSLLFTPGLAAGAIGVGVIKETLKSINDKYSVKTGDSFDLIAKYTEGAAFALDEGHCVKNFDKFQNATSITLKSLADNASDDWEDFIKTGSYFGECLWILDKKKDSNKSFGDVSTKVDVNNDVAYFTTAGSLSGKYGNYNIERDAINVKNEMIVEANRLNSKANVNRLTVSAHYYVVGNAIAEGFAKILETQTDKDMPKNMRKQGWAGLGGLILSITTNQVDASSYMSRLSGAITWSSVFGGESSGLFINESSYGDENEIKKYNQEFSTMNLRDFFSGYKAVDVIGNSTSTGSSEDEENDEFVKQLTRWLENGLTHPMRYLKNMGGLDKKLTIREGVEKCYRDGNCKTGDMHPVSALVYMGNDLIDITITFFIVKAVVNGLSKVLNTIDGEKESAGAVSGFKKLIPIFTLLSAGKFIMNLLAGILNVLSTPMFLLLMLGLFFAYLLPLMPYVIYLMQFIGWIVLLYTLLFSVQIWLMMIFIPSSTGEPRGDVNLIWQYFGQLIFKPSFIVIGLIIGWYMSAVLVYVVNMTFFGVISALTEVSTGPIRSVIDIIMFYVTYLIIIIVVLKYSFQMITTFPDLAAKAINLKDGSDQGARSAMSDRLLTAAVMQQVISQTTSGVSNSIDKEVSGRFRDREMKLRNDQNVNDMVNDRFNDRFGKPQSDESIKTPSENFGEQNNASKTNKDMEDIVKNSESHVGKEMENYNSDNQEFDYGLGDNSNSNPNQTNKNGGKSGKDDELV